MPYKCIEVAMNTIFLCAITYIYNIFENWIFINIDNFDYYNFYNCNLIWD